MDLADQAVTLDRDGYAARAIASVEEPLVHPHEPVDAKGIACSAAAG